MNASNALWMRWCSDVVRSTHRAPHTVNDDVLIEKILAHAVAKTVESPRFQLSDELYKKKVYYVKYQKLSTHNKKMNHKKIVYGASYVPWGDNVRRLCVHSA